MALANFYAAGPLIVARLKAQVPAFHTVASGSFLAGATDVSKFIQPAGAFVMPGASPRKSAAGRGQAIEIRQTWDIVVCVPHVLDPQALETTEAAAGPFVLGVVAALAGWQPLPELGRLVYAEDQPDPHFLPGRAEFTVVFETEFVIKGN